ncbi:toll/interleukin-1 receptor domain-containing protein [Sphingobacterium multivorum]|uniref:toll/interleukin-1 receptor domain-containing protein n=1 Tax=Sphingobacterium multivorum TaxID=28454 RepID=UPI0028A6B9C2|nr:toll/interleukin-1 receptor domain-containing protein [Sphingobacterium multivorum]
MRYFNKVELRSIPKEKVILAGLERMINESQIDEQFDIFLSHSYLDQDIVYALYTDLTKRGFKVYVDWLIDPDLNRDLVTKKTAEIIRTRLNHSKSLIIAISENSAISKWIPWELGFVDGNCGKCCVLPIMEKEDSKNIFHGREYLKLYPQIKKQVSLSGNDTLYVEENQNKIAFRSYLKF